MRFAVILLISLVVELVWAQSPFEVRPPNPVAIKLEPHPRSRTIFFTKANEEVTILGDSDGEYTRVSVFREGDLEVGYAKTEELFPQKTALKKNSKAYRGLGAGAYWVHLSQLGKTFVGSDQVKSTTSDNSSQSLGTVLVYQKGYRDFWRLSVGLLETNFRGTATKDVGINLFESLLIQHQMVSVGFERAWQLFGSSNYYYGFGGQTAMAQRMKILLGGVEVETTAQDLPIFFGLQGLVGAQIPLNSSLSGFLELRLGSYVSQSAPIFWADLGTALLYAF